MQKPPVTFSSSTLFTSGMGQVIIARFKNGGRVELGVFLLDIYCLGVKNAFYTQCLEPELPDLLERFFPGDSVEEHTGAWGRKLVEGAINYARNLGFTPNRDYKLAARVMGGIDSKTCPDSFVFGYEGKPHFIAGPNDNEKKCELIISALTRKFGADGFHFTIPSGDFFNDDDD